MKYHGFAKAALLAATVVSTSSCAMLFGSAGGPESVDNLVSRVEAVYVACEKAKQTTSAAITQLQTITSSEFQGEPAAAHSAFLKTIERSEGQADNLRYAIEAMKDAGPAVFEQWTKDLEGFDNSEMRRRSLRRLLDTRERYDRISGTADPAQVAFTDFNRGLRDCALFLRHDYNTASMADIQKDARNQAQKAQELETKLNACLQASRAYMEAVSLPVGEDRVQDGDSASDPETVTDTEEAPVETDR